MLFILIVCLFIANAKMLKLHFCAVYYFNRISEEKHAGLANRNERSFDLTRPFTWQIIFRRMELNRSSHIESRFAFGSKNPIIFSCRHFKDIQISNNVRGSAAANVLTVRLIIPNFLNFVFPPQKPFFVLIHNQPLIMLSDRAVVCEFDSFY